MPFVDNAGVSIHWQEDGEGPPLLLIMGTKLSSRLWYPAIPALAQHFRVIRFDNRGTGRSDAPRRFEVADMVADALAVMDAAGLRSAHVYGVSMGGGIAMELAMRHPERVRSLILGCTTIKTRQTQRWPRWMLMLPPWLLLRLLPRSGPKSYGSAAEPDRIAFEQAAATRDPHSPHGVIAQAMAVSRYATTEAQAAGIRAPALVIHGDEDLLVSCEAGRRISEVLPNARFELLRGAGHNYFVAAGTRANRLAIDFLLEQEARAPESPPAVAGETGAQGR